MRRLVVRGVMGGVVWIGGGGRRCRVWGPVMGFLVAVAGRGTRSGVCQQGHRHQLAGAGCRVLRPWPDLGGGGLGGVVWGWHCWWWGGRGWVLCWLGIWALLWVVWVLRVCTVRSLRFLAGFGAVVWVGGGRMGVRVGRWSVCYGWLLVDGARWYGVWVGGLLVVVRLLLRPGVAGVGARLPVGPWGCTVARVSWARVVGAAGGAGPRGGGGEGMLVVCGTPALVGVVVGAGGGGICDGVVR